MIQFDKHFIRVRAPNPAIDSPEGFDLPVELDEPAIRAAFSQPENDGVFAGAFGDYLAALGKERPSVIFAFPPKAAGTFLRTAAITAIDGQLMRIVHAQGGRDGQPYLPLFIGYYNGLMGEKTLVTHVHMLALPANRRLIEALDLKPIVMTRSIPDMIASYWDMLDKDDAALADGLNGSFPENFRSLKNQKKAELLVDMLAPWYATYYATWLSYAKENPGRVCVLDYEAFATAPGAALETALAHAGVPRQRSDCQVAVEMALMNKNKWRFNVGEPGRGRTYFSDSQIAAIRRMLSYYPALAPLVDKLAG